MDNYLPAQNNTNTVPALPYQYQWLAIEDPSGMFHKRYFPTRDVEAFNRTGEVEGWPDGIVFEHIRTGEIRTVQGGKMNRYCVHGWGLYRQWVTLAAEIKAAGGNPAHSQSANEAEKKFREHIASCRTCKNLIARLFAYAEKQEVKPHA